MFYVFHGDDAFSCAEELASLTTKMGDPEMASLNTTRLDGWTITLDELWHHCNTMPFFADRRLVIVKGLLTRLAQKGQKAELGTLVERLPLLSPTTRLIFVEDHKISQNHPVLALASKSNVGYVKAFNLPTGNALIRWIQKRVKQAGGEISPGATRTLGTFVGNDLYQLHQEIEKLIAYTNGERPISEQDVSLLTPHVREGNIFAMVDALGHRDGETASHIYHQLLAAGEHPLALLGMITRQFRLMIQIKELAPKLVTPQAIARELHQNPYPVKKILQQSKNYSATQLQAVYHKLLETDVEIKTGKVNAPLALDLLIAGLSRAA